MFSVSAHTKNVALLFFAKLLFHKIYSEWFIFSPHKRTIALSPARTHEIIIILDTKVHTNKRKKETHLGNGVLKINI